jgi:hypothetical protein
MGPGTRPALIARCRGVADVVDTINLTRRLGLEMAVRGGGPPRSRIAERVATMIADQVRCRRRMTRNHVGWPVFGVPTDCPAVVERWPSGPVGPRDS